MNESPLVLLPPISPVMRKVESRSAVGMTTHNPIPHDASNGDAEAERTGGRMNAEIERALARDRTIDITTIGRRTGVPRRIETWFYRAQGRYYLSGSPGRRDWYANLVANPAFTFHLKQMTTADLPARARAITDAEERRAIMREITAGVGQTDRLEAWIAGSPLMEITFEPSTR